MQNRAFTPINEIELAVQNNKKSILNPFPLNHLPSSNDSLYSDLRELDELLRPLTPMNTTIATPTSPPNTPIHDIMDMEDAEFDEAIKEVDEHMLHQFDGNPTVQRLRMKDFQNKGEAFKQAVEDSIKTYNDEQHMRALIKAPKPQTPIETAVETKTNETDKSTPSTPASSGAHSNTENDMNKLYQELTFDHTKADEEHAASAMTWWSNSAKKAANNEQHKERKVYFGVK